ncbi:DUF58 domain-containing protein [Desulforegula conservatrix]|uniref:DUF58 domain-containing protein n=1 Tax=Desulforegula conservatrix TaxID=153026 RepID=UPI0004270099|nr:DUF58 domain-containing protein [Desulforegula conservatrix]
MISLEILKKIKRIHIKSRRIADSMMTGKYRSAFKGVGMEFEEVREYVPGDEVRSIDWKVSARMGRPFVKLFKEERERIVMLLIDMSASNRFGSKGSLKLEKAAEIAAVLAFNAIRSGDKSGALLFTDKVEKYIQPKRGAGHIWMLLREIFSFEPEGKGTDISEALAYFARVCRKKSLAFLVSDFIAEKYDKELRHVARKHELISVMISDKSEYTLPESGVFLLRDLETGAISFADAGDRVFKNAFIEKRTKIKNDALAIMKSGNIDVIDVDTESDVSEKLENYFRKRERRFARLGGS